MRRMIESKIYNYSIFPYPCNSVEELVLSSLFKFIDLDLIDHFDTCGDSTIPAENWKIAIHDIQTEAARAIIENIFAMAELIKKADKQRAIWIFENSTDTEEE